MERRRGQLLRILIDETDTWSGLPLHTAIVGKAKELGLSGATVFRGISGFGSSGRIRGDSFWGQFLTLSYKIPVAIEIVDRTERIETILPFIEEAVSGGLVTIEEVGLVGARAELTPVGRS
jgi:hypothetical protein